MAVVGAGSGAVFAAVAVVGAGLAAVFAAATASFVTAAVASAVSVLCVTTVLWCFCWYYSSAVIVAG